MRNGAVRETNGPGVPGIVDVIAQWRLPIVTLATSLVVALFVIGGLTGDPEVEAKLQTDIIELDRDADGPASLVKPVTLTPGRLRQMLITTSPLTGVEVEDLLVAAEKRDQGTEFVIRLATNDTHAASDHLNAWLSAFVERENQRRSEQKEEAASWIEDLAAARQAEIEAAKTAIRQSPFNPEALDGRRLSDEEKLLRLFIRATTEAEAAVGAGQRRAARAGGDDDLARLTGALAGLEKRRVAHLRQRAALRDAQSGLARLRVEAGQLMAKGGVFDRPAAEVIAPASPVEGIALLPQLGWDRLLPFLAVLSLAAAAAGAVVAYRRWPRPVVAAGDCFRQPHWPLPRRAYRESSS